MNPDNSSTTPSDPLIFSRVGFKDRGYLRKTLEIQAKQRQEANMTSNEQTYVSTVIREGTGGEANAPALQLHCYQA